MNKPDYRADIDGLRAIAIIAVVLFHLGIDPFTGGYVGVDVFFTISGFLITSIIYKEVLSGRFSFIEFYERRIRRIFPALITVIVASSVAALVLMWPTDLIAVSRSVVAALLFYVNVHFRSTAGYFDAPAETKPLLHAWSLSVEEQFYLVFPVLLIFIARYFKQYLPLVITALAIASITAAQIVVQQNPAAAFYLFQYRAWELMLGAILAMGVVPAPTKPWQRELSSVVGMLLIGYGVLALDRETVFPGLYAVYPSLGAALVIYAGMNGTSFFSRWLSFRPMIFIGLISYSLYLWHWPLIVFSKYIFGNELSMSAKLSILTSSLVLSAISWKYIEQPFRGRDRIWSRKSLYRWSAVITGGMVCVAIAGAMSNGLPRRLPEEALTYVKAANSSNKYHKNCFEPLRTQPLSAVGCHLGSGEHPTFMLWGDSHALAIAPAVNELARSEGRLGLLSGAGGCPAIMRVVFKSKVGRKCDELNDHIAAFLAKNDQIKTVILVSRWARVATGNKKTNRDEAEASIDIANSEAEQTKVFLDGLGKTFQFLSSHGKKIIFVTQVPEIGWDVPPTLARAARFGVNIPAAPSREDYSRRQKNVTDALRELSGKYKFQVVYMEKLFCPEKDCLVQIDGQSLYQDGHHISNFGAEYAARALKGALSIGRITPFPE